MCTPARSSRMASLPDFDPNDRPAPLIEGRRRRQPAVQPGGAGGLRTGLDLQDLRRRAGDGTGAGQRRTRMIDTNGADALGPVPDPRIPARTTDRDLSVTDVIVKVLQRRHRADRADDRAGAAAGLPRPARLLRADCRSNWSRRRRAKPLVPARWSELVDDDDLLRPRHVGLARCIWRAAYASLLNGGTKVTPTLMRRDAVAAGPRG